MKLSENLTLKEALRSDTATRLGIKNVPDQWEINNLTAIAQNVFQPMRDHFGIPIGVTSGYRCKALNTAIGGSKYSQHMVGEALDIDAHMCGGVTNKELFNYIKDNLDWDQMIWEFGSEDEPDWIHISYKEGGNNRKQIRSAHRDEKGIYYKPM